MQIIKPVLTVLAPVIFFSGIFWPGQSAEQIVNTVGKVMPSDAAIVEGLDYLKHGGTYVEYGHYVDSGTFECNPNQSLLRKNLRLEAAWGFESNHFIRSLRMLEKHADLFKDFVSHVIPLERVGEGVNALHAGYHLDGRDAIKIAVKAHTG